MDQPDLGPDRLAGAFAELRSASLRQVTDPDPDEPRRRAYRRLRNRTAVPAVATAVVLLAGAVGLAGSAVRLPPAPVTATGPTGLPSAWPSTGSASSEPSPASPSAAPSDGSPSATPSRTATPTPAPTTGAPAPSGPRPGGTPSATSARYVDLSIDAPRTLTLQPSDGAYAGWLDVTMANAGTRAYDSGDLVVVLPVEATLVLDGTGIGGCFHQGQNDDTKTMFCTGESQIPAGGSRSYRFGVRVDVAPGGPARTLTGFALTVRANVRGAFPADRTPADNTAPTDLRLPSA
ncbi:hypothetical protein ACGF7U_12365 [Micromonospora sp. NPDC047670]|uniref:hypothetical protein n=1 Tax=Micromonospora sp. NPDC047670 TaxID=3364252 RepID=UPI00371233E5